MNFISEFIGYLTDDPLALKPTKNLTPEFDIAVFEYIDFKSWAVYYCFNGTWYLLTKNKNLDKGLFKTAYAPVVFSTRQEAVDYASKFTCIQDIENYLNAKNEEYVASQGFLGKVFFKI